MTNCLFNETFIAIVAHYEPCCINCVAHHYNRGTKNNFRRCFKSTSHTLYNKLSIFVSNHINVSVGLITPREKLNLLCETKIKIGALNITNVSHNTLSILHSHHFLHKNPIIRTTHNENATIITTKRLQSAPSHL